MAVLAGCEDAIYVDVRGRGTGICLLILSLSVHAHTQTAERLQGPVHQPCLARILAGIALRESLPQVSQEILHMDISLKDGGYIMDVCGIYRR